MGSTVLERHDGFEAADARGPRSDPRVAGGAPDPDQLPGGAPRHPARPPTPRWGDNSREAAIRSLQELHRLAASLEVRVAAEVIPNDLSTANSLVQVLEEDLDVPEVGVCMDFGHAFIMGDLVDSIEAVSGHLITTHIHDNDGPRDEHLVPFDGAIEWPGALMATQKIGYDGTLLLEVGNTSTPKAVLRQAQLARQRLERLLSA